MIEKSHIAALNRSQLFQPLYNEYPPLSTMQWGTPSMAFEERRWHCGIPPVPSIEFQDSMIFIPFQTALSFSLTISVLIEKGECLLKFSDLFFSELLCHLVLLVGVGVKGMKRSGEIKIEQPSKRKRKKGVQ